MAQSVTVEAGLCCNELTYQAVKRYEPVVYAFNANLLDSNSTQTSTRVHKCSVFVSVPESLLVYDL